MTNQDLATFSSVFGLIKSYLLILSVFLLLWFPDDGFIRPVTFWVVGDFDKPSGRQLLYDAIKHMVQKLLLSHLFVLL